MFRWAHPVDAPIFRKEGSVRNDTMNERVRKNAGGVDRAGVPTLINCDDGTAPKADIIQMVETEGARAWRAPELFFLELIHAVDFDCQGLS